MITDSYHKHNMKPIHVYYIYHKNSKALIKVFRTVGILYFSTCLRVSFLLHSIQIGGRKMSSPSFLALTLTLAFPLALHLRFFNVKIMATLQGMELL